jgi:hypothetical protein
MAAAPAGPANSEATCRAAEVASAQMLDGAPDLIAPGHQLLVKLKDFPNWLSCRQMGKTPLPILYLDHVARADLPAGVDTEHQALRFSLRLTENNRGAWVASSGRNTVVTVGLGDKSVESSDVSDTEIAGEAGAPSSRVPFRIALADARSKEFGLAYVAVILIISILGAWMTRLVRDRGPLAPGVTEWVRSYSLARTQLWLWTVTVSATAGYLWITSGMLPALGVETLALLGISAGTLGAAKLIDAGTAVPVQVKPTSGFFLLDLLDDGSGASVHRFQSVLANVGLAIVFFFESVRQLDFYTIPPSWVAMLGLSSGLYLGLKSGEGK